MKNQTSLSPAGSVVGRSFLGVLGALGLIFAPALLQAAPRQSLPGHVPKAAARLQAVGRLPASQKLKLAIGLPLRNREVLTNLLDQLYDPAAPNYHQWLTPQEFTARFGPTEPDYQALIAFAESHGLSVRHQHPNRTVLDVEGSVRDIESTLQVTLRSYQHPKERRTFFAPDSDPAVDAPVPVLHISGLDNYDIPRPNLKQRPHDAATKASPKIGSAPDGSYLGRDFRTAYVPGSSLTGAGQIVGLLQLDGYDPADITAYEDLAGLPHVPLVNISIDGGPGAPGGNNGEVCLDIEMVVSMAPGVSAIYLYQAPNPSPWADILSCMADQNIAKQLSCSWGGGGPDLTCEAIFQQMAAQGQSFFNATGDSDAFTGDVPFPSDSPHVTQVGGTTLTTLTPGGAYVSETVWNWGGGQGSSGGSSTYYPLPAYQLGLPTAANLASAHRRNMPDVAMTGDNVYVLYNSGGAGSFGGTSCAAPLWAGFTALVNQRATENGQPPVGFLNPALYNLARRADYGSIIHDVTTGDNTSPGSPDRFYAVAGYDLCTGWGTPNGVNLIEALQEFAGQVWVAFGGADPGVGSYARPYNTLAQGVGAVAPGGTVLFKTTGSSAETMTILKRMTIRAEAGAATIGR